jgi:hypothetical protein
MVGMCLSSMRMVCFPRSNLPDWANEHHDTGAHITSIVFCHTEIKSFLENLK